MVVETDEELAQSLHPDELALGVLVVVFEVVGSHDPQVLLLVTGSTGLLLVELQTAQLLLTLLVGSAPLVTQTGLPVMTVVTTLQTGCWLSG